MVAGFLIACCVFFFADKGCVRASGPQAGSPQTVTATHDP